jgi:primosomal protein N' (replication factor Y) (superfamily II helicase)
MFAEVVFPLPFRNAFSYSVPPEFKDLISVGKRVAAPFGKRVLTGFVIALRESVDVKETIKDIQDVLDKDPIFDLKDLEFYRWIAEYYLSSLGEALKLSVPQGVEVETKRKVIADADFCKKLLETESKKNTTRIKILELLSVRNDISYTALQKLLKKKNIYSSIRSLEKEGAISVIDELEDAKVKIKKQKYVELNKSVGEIYAFIPEIERKAPNQVSTLLELIAKKNKPYALSALTEKLKITSQVVNALEKKGLVRIIEKEVERKYSEKFTEAATEFTLTDQQNKVIAEVTNNIEDSKFEVFLLHGVTGSGKTQVYIELITKVLAKGKTALVLVPEISLTPQMTIRLFNHFGESVALLHSRMSLGERFDSWRKILSGKSRVVVGARSALFAPLKDIGLIVVDEEHDSSYKQQDVVPKYYARDAAVVRGKFSNCPVILGSATPSIESMYNAKTGKYKLIELPERIDNAKLPKITLVNVIIERKKKRMENIFSKTMLEKIDDRLKKHEGTVILQNRRGFATQVFCNDCGEIETCENCSVAMTLHLNQNILHCHYCGLTKKVPNACTTCGSLSIKYFGTGTERVEDELAYYFPDARIARLDSDSIQKKDSLSNILNSFKKGDIDVLIGTQLVAKGMDIPRVTLVGVISAETSLWMPDFRADERTFQLLTQVAGRAGRSQIEGEVVIQTQNENHFVLKMVLENNYQKFYDKEIKDRETVGYPPFTRLCLIETKDLEDEKAKGAIDDFYKEIYAFRKYFKVLPPSTPTIAKLKNNYRYQILLKSERSTDQSGAILRQALLNSFTEFNKKSRYRDVRITFDIDPQNVI